MMQLTLWKATCATCDSSHSASLSSSWLWCAHFKTSVYIWKDLLTPGHSRHDRQSAANGRIDHRRDIEILVET
jgi:hypothetical protein